MQFDNEEQEDINEKIRKELDDEKNRIQELKERADKELKYLLSNDINQ